MKCKYCGYESPEDMQYCSYCGKELKDSSSLKKDIVSRAIAVLTFTALAQAAILAIIIISRM